MYITDSQDPLQLLNSKNFSVNRNGSYIYMSMLSLWQPPTLHEDHHLRDQVFSLIDAMILVLTQLFSCPTSFIFREFLPEGCTKINLQFKI